MYYLEIFLFIESDIEYSSLRNLAMGVSRHNKPKYSIGIVYF